MNTTPAPTALYLVGVAPQGSLSGFTSQGLEPDQRASVTSVAGFDAVTVHIPADVFAGDDAESHLTDITWLTPRVEKHEAILRAARERTTVLPVGFGSVFSSTEALAHALDAQTPQIVSFLDAAASCDEWSLTIVASRSELTERSRQMLAAASHESEGIAYLRARQLQGRAETHAEELALDQIQTLLDALEPFTIDAVERDVLPHTDDPDRWTLAHLALLVHRSQQRSFDAELDKQAASLEVAGMRVELSGPWAPYSFAPTPSQHS